MHLGKLEHELSAALNEALLHLGRLRPKFVKTSIEASACVYLALCLKTKVKGVSKRRQYVAIEQKQMYERDCTLGSIIQRTTTLSTIASSVPTIQGIATLTTTSTEFSESDYEETRKRFDELLSCTNMEGFLAYTISEEQRIVQA